MSNDYKKVASSYATVKPKVNISSCAYPIILPGDGNQFDFSKQLLSNTNLSPLHRTATSLI